VPSLSLDDRVARANPPGVEADPAQAAESHLQVGVGLLGQGTPRPERLVVLQLVDSETDQHLCGKGLSPRRVPGSTSQ
jgi:hypothetical protein